MGKNRLRWYVNILLAVLVFGSWFSVFFFGAGSLVRNGLGSLKYFTMLSNIFVGVMAVAWLVSVGKSGKTIAAIRTLISGAGGRIGLRMTVEVLD